MEKKKDFYVHSDINECKDSDPGCHANATCTNNPGNFSCSCNSGFTGDGISCSGKLSCKAHKN